MARANVRPNFTLSFTRRECVYYYILVVALCCLSSAADPFNMTKSCPCSKESLCQPVNVTYDKEVFVFSVGGKDWASYNWSLITTVAMFGDYDPGLMCQAHSVGARVVLKGLPPVSELRDPAARKAWIAKQVALAKTQFMDGINIDTEDALNATEAVYLTELVREARDTFHAAIPHSQVSFDVAWSPDCIDGRCYDYLGLAAASDLLFVMSYDEQGQILTGPCIAMANAPYGKTAGGLEGFLKMGISPDKLVLGVPWYGYDYPCLSITEDEVCTIPFHPFRGVNCSDAAGSQKCYSKIMNMIKTSGIKPKWNDTYTAPYFSYKDTESQQYHQVWYDNPASLTARYKYAKSKGLLGVGMWEADCLDYSSGAEKETQAMWTALESFF